MTILATQAWHSDASLDWGQRVGPYSHVPALIRQLGGEPDAILASAGLPPDALDDSENRIPFVAHVAFLDAAAQATRCAHFGLLAGRMWRLADLGLVGELVASSRNVGEALETLTVHQHLNSEGGLAFMLKRAGMVDVGYAIYHPGVRSTGHLYDAVLALAMNMMRELCGPGWTPTEVFLPHSKPPAVAPYRSVFWTNVRFDADTCALRFPESWLEHPLSNCDSERARTVQVDRPRVLAPTASLVARVYRALRLVMLHGRTSGDAVAQALSMHRRTLNRRLQSEGVTFQRILDDVRLAVARELLGSSHLSLDDIAAALGYAGVNGFMRAFNRWTGHSPGEWRHAAQRGELPDAVRPLPHRSPPAVPCMGEARRISPTRRGGRRRKHGTEAVRSR